MVDIRQIRTPCDAMIQRTDAIFGYFKWESPACPIGLKKVVLPLCLTLVQVLLEDGV